MVRSAATLSPLVELAEKIGLHREPLREPLFSLGVDRNGCPYPLVVGEKLELVALCDRPTNGSVVYGHGKRYQTAYGLKLTEGAIVCRYP